MIKQSRRFTLVDLPDPLEIKAEFVYNFFVPDERLNDSGDQRVPGAAQDDATQSMINNRVLRTEIPRYVNINFKPPSIVEFGNFGDTKNTINLEDKEYNDISGEEEMTNAAFVAVSESDPVASSRIAEKMKALSNISGLDFSDPFQSEILSDMLGVPKGKVQTLISPYGDKSSMSVNTKPLASAATMYDVATQLSLNSLVSKRFIGVSSLGGDDVSPLSSLKLQSEAQEISEAFLATANEFSLTEDDIEASILPRTSPIEVRPTEDSKILGVNILGYHIIRYQMSPDGNILSSDYFAISGRDNTRYLDDNIIYGSKYAYAVKAIYQLDAIVAVPDGDKTRKFQISTYIASRPTSFATVKTEEYEPPLAPDGLFYHFNYGSGKGLILHWQIPPGSSRDVKFFQVFKRRSIYEPFKCIAELNFDDSKVKTLRSEMVRSDKVIRSLGASTSFEDMSFSRESPPMIYAVCAVDAHGMTSGYSAQTLVGFDKTKNILTLKNISKPDAPKQYPNFFIDPDLDDNLAVDSFSQDAIFDSGHMKMDVYFTPDAKIIETSAGKKSNIISTDNDQGKYKVHVLNLDLQKSTTVELKVDDLQNL